MRQILFRRPDNDYITGLVPIFSFIFMVVICFLQASKRKNREPKEENVTLGPAVREGEHVFGVAHIFASFNDTFIVSLVYLYVCVCVFFG